MDYLFGTMRISNEMRHTLRVKAASNETLPQYEDGNYYNHIQSYPDVTLTDSYKVDSKLQESSDSEGNTYVWYVLSEYSRNIDRSNAVAMQATQYNDETNAKLDYVAMMTDIDIPEFSNDEGGEM